MRRKRHARVDVASLKLKGGRGIGRGGLTKRHRKVPRDNIMIRGINKRMSRLLYKPIPESKTQEALT